MNFGHHDLMRRLVDAHFAGAISPSKERTLRDHLADCEGCRRYYERHLLLESLDPAARGPEERIGNALGLTRRERPVASWGFATAAAAALAVTLGALSGGHLPWARHAGGVASVQESESDPFAPRGSDALGSAPQLLVYRLRPNEPSELVDETITASDELAFAYSNPTGLEHLLVFGVDEHRHVYWYYPAWAKEEENPVGISLSSGPEIHELPEAVSQPLDGKTLRIVGVFTHDKVAVKDVERLLAAHSSLSSEALDAIPGAARTEISLRIERP